MQVLFSAVEKGDEKLTNMVGEDIRTAVENGKAEDNLNELSYEHKGDGVVAITDKKTGEVTLAEKDPENEEEFNLWTPDMQIEGYVHPEGDGVTPGQQKGAPDEKAADHIEGGSISDQHVPTVCDNDNCGCGESENEAIKTFSAKNSAAQKVFSRSILVESLFSEVIESEETATVGDLKFEKVPEEDAIVVTDKKTGHQVKVTMNEEEMKVTELESKNFGEDEGDAADHFESVGFWVVGLDADNHQLVESQAATEETANEAANRFEENGMTGVEIFDNLEEASEYSRHLMNYLGADEEEIEDEDAEVEEREFSDGTVYYTRTFSTNHSDLMYRMFSEAVCDKEACKKDEEVIKDALRDGNEIKIEGDVIIPLREDFGLIHDTNNNEYTKVGIDDGGELSYEKIDEDEAEELKEEAFSVYSNVNETRFFSARESFTDYMVRLFSEEADEEDIAQAIESGEQIERDNEIVTPVDDHTAVIEDKKTGEYTKATLEGEDNEEINVVPITEEEADELTKDLVVEEEKEKEFSVYTNENETRFFSENEEMTNYMVRLFSEEADEEEVVDAIKSGEIIENKEETITPIDDTTAIVEDKETGEFTKVVLESEEEGELEVNPVSEEEAKDLLEEAEKNFSVYTNEKETRFFSANEEMTNYMVRLFTEDADEEAIVDSIKSGEEKEHENEVITPINDTTAVIEDKESGEFTVATLGGKEEEEIEVKPISKEEAENLIDHKESMKKFSTLTRFFAEVAPTPAEGPITKEVTLEPGQSVVIVDENGKPVEQPSEEQPAENSEAAPTSVEAIEDKALAAVQSIQEAAAAAEQAIQEAKAAPAENAEAPLQEAQFSQKTYSNNGADTLLTWLKGNGLG